jgi:hypothetical protein
MGVSYRVGLFNEKMEIWLENEFFGLVGGGAHYKVMPKLR